MATPVRILRKRMLYLRPGLALVLLAACSPRQAPPPQAPDAPLAVGPATAPPLRVVSSCAEPTLAPAAGRERAIDLFLADRPAEADAALQKVLAADPRDRAADVFLAASKKKLANAQTRNGDVLRGARRVKLAPIALAATVVHPAAETGAKVTLAKTSEAKNLITTRTTGRRRPARRRYGATSRARSHRSSSASGSARRSVIPITSSHSTVRRSSSPPMESSRSSSMRARCSAAVRVHSRSASPSSWGRR